MRKILQKLETGLKILIICVLIFAVFNLFSSTEPGKKCIETTINFAENIHFINIDARLKLAEKNGYTFYLDEEEINYESLPEDRENYRIGIDDGRKMVYLTTIEQRRENE